MVVTTTRAHDAVIGGDAHTVGRLDRQLSHFVPAQRVVPAQARSVNATVIALFATLCRRLPREITTACHKQHPTDTSRKARRDALTDALLSRWKATHQPERDLRLGDCGEAYTEQEV